MTTNSHNCAEDSTGASVQRSDLEDLPWWAGVLLTVADISNRPWLSVLVWGLVISRAGMRALGRHRRSKDRPERSE